MKLKNEQEDINKITLFLTNSDIIRDLRGHYYPEINIPTEPKVTLEQANNNLFGEDISYINIAGRFTNKKIETKDLNNNGVLIVLAWEKTESLEYRLVWQIPFGRSKWLGYIDALTGEILEITQKVEIK